MVCLAHYDDLNWQWCHYTLQFAKLARDLRENPPEGLFMSTGGGGGGGSTNAAGGKQEESEDEYADGLC